MPVVAVVSVPHVPTNLSPQAVAAAYVQTMPLYKEAQVDCRQKRFAEAAQVLARLAATSGMSAEELVFCRDQYDICLHDAGLPVPKRVAVAPPKPPVRSSPTPSLIAASADCGPRALALVCQSLGVSISVVKLRELAKTTQQGTSMDGLAKAANAVGLKTEGVQVSREGLPEIETPAVVWVNPGHYVALLALKGEGEQGVATIHDPNLPNAETIDQERLLRMSIAVENWFSANLDEARLTASPHVGWSTRLRSRSKLARP